MTIGLAVLAAVLLVGAAAGLAVVIGRGLVARAERHRRARLVADAKRDLRDLARQASRARYDLITRQRRQ